MFFHVRNPHNYKSSIRYITHGPPLLQYIQQRNEWTPAILKTIAWHAHELALCHHIHQQVHMTKLIHDILLTNDIVSPWLPKCLEKCLSCPLLVKDRDHVVCCPHTARQEWHQKFLISVPKPAIYSTQDPTYKKSCSTASRPGSLMNQPIFLNIPQSILSSSTIRPASDGISYSTDASALNGHGSKTNISSSKESAPKRRLALMVYQNPDEHLG